MGPRRRASSPISVTIEVDSDPVAGSITRPGQVELDFVGWLELLVILDRVHRGDPSDRLRELDID